MVRDSRRASTALRPLSALALFVLASCTLAYTPTFTDTTKAAGVTNQRKLKKYGGPTICDLDNDGFPDMVFVHHDQFFNEVWFNNGDGTFTKSPFQRWTDMHGIVCGPFSSYSREVRFLISSGGNFGMNPAFPKMYKVAKSRAITEITTEVGINQLGGRGRTTAFVNLGRKDRQFWPDIMVVNAPVTMGAGPQNWGFENVGAGKYELRTLEGFTSGSERFGLTDIDGDGSMEIISFHFLQVHRLIGPFKFADISKDVLPASVLQYQNRVSVTAMAEVDIDNDGDFDLYIARGRYSWLDNTVVNVNDILLENQNGKYVDVSAKAGIPKGGDHRGVTVGDFNSDGHMDIMIFPRWGQSYVLQNRGDGTYFVQGNLISRPAGTRGDNGMAVDYDLDGNIDLIVSQGDHDIIGAGGEYKIFRNSSNRRGMRYLLVRVGHAPNRSATSIHAVVTVKAGGKTMIRRVGSPGNQIGRSYIEWTHFGLGPAAIVDSVSVRWSSGTTESKTSVKIDSKVNFGIL